MTDVNGLLKAYDDQLRTDAETLGAISVTAMGAVRLVTFARGRGFVTYPRPDGPAADRLPDQVVEVLDHFREDPGITRVEWKTRGHDGVARLHEALIAAGFAPEEPESVMVGRAELLAVDVALPPGVALRRVTEAADIGAMAVMQSIAFGTELTEEMTQDSKDRLARGDGTELWVAEVGAQIVCAGRLEPVASTQFAGIWGGATLPEWRGRGIYRALTAAWAHSALAAGKTLIHSDSTEFSRPILERSGMVKVSTTTPYYWTAGAPTAS